MIDRCKFLHNLPCEQVSDRIVELETENENLMKTVDSVMPSLIEDNARLKRENAKLRELVYDMLVDEERGHNDELTFDEHVERANELGVEFYG